MQYICQTKAVVGVVIRFLCGRRALGEGTLHDLFVGLASADDAVVRPHRSAHPLPLLGDVRVCLFDELAHSADGFPAPVAEFGDSFRDELRRRRVLARVRMFQSGATGSGLAMMHLRDYKT